MYQRNARPGGASFVSALLAVLFLAAAARAQTTAFTYQGRLTDGGSPANGNYDLQFTLWDALSGGAQQPTAAPATQTKTNVAVSDGVFSVLLDFGVNAFPGADRFLEVGVRPAGSGGAFTLLAPRQQISSTPYALRTLRAAAADSLSSACVGCVSDSQIASVAASKLTGTIPASALPAGGSFIQNSTAVQADANFNVGGNGIVGGRLGVGTASPAFPIEEEFSAGSQNLKFLAENTDKFEHSCPTCGIIFMAQRPRNPAAFAAFESYKWSRSNRQGGTYPAHVLFKMRCGGA